MKIFLKTLLYRFLLALAQKTENARIHYNSQFLVLGNGSRLYSEASVQNIGGDKNSIVVGENTHIRGELLTMKYGGKITIGDYCYIGQGCRIWSGENIRIGSNVLISHNVNIIDTNSHELHHEERAEGYKNMLLHGHPASKGSIKTAQIVVEDNAWISFNCTVLSGVTIGKGAIVGANSLVVDDVEPFTIVAGNPAKVIRHLNAATK